MRFAVIITLNSRFSVKKASVVITLFRMFRTVDIRLFCKREQSVLFKTRQGSLYQLTSLAYGSLHIVASMYVRFRYSGKKSDADCVFLAYFCAILRFSDPPYAPLPKQHVMHRESLQRTVRIYNNNFRLIRPSIVFTSNCFSSRTFFITIPEIPNRDCRGSHTKKAAKMEYSKISHIRT